MAITRKGLRLFLAGLLVIVAGFIRNEVQIPDLAAFDIVIGIQLVGGFRGAGIPVQRADGIGGAGNLIDGKPDGKRMGAALQARLDAGFTFLKMDLGIDLIYDVPGALSAPLGFVEQLKSVHGVGGYDGTIEERYEAHRRERLNTIEHPYTAIQITEKGLDWLEQYCADVRSVIGYEVPLAIDHLGHIGVNEAIKLGRRIEKFNIAWMEDAVPWMYTDQYRLLQQSIQIPVCTAAEEDGGSG